LEEAAGMKIGSFTQLMEALDKRMDYFASMGCKVSDHGLPYVMYAPSCIEDAERIFRGRLEGSMPYPAEEAQFMTAC
ncbi:glucuronate isomerase, partial [Klebsiella oxytoca]